MVLDRLDNAALYFGLGERIATALRYLQVAPLGTLAPGRHDIEGPAVFALVSDYETRPQEAAFWEAHRRHIDVQYVHSGVELVGYAPLAHMTAGPYDEEKDFLVAEGAGDFLHLPAGSFAIFGPADAHMPGIAVAAPAPIRKIVIKLLVRH